MKKIFKQLKKPKVLRAVIAVVVTVILIVAYYFWQVSKDRVIIEDSLVNVPIISISPQTAGKLREIDVYENEQVKRGDTLAVIGSETLYADSDGLIVMTNNQIGSLFTSQTPVVQMIRSIDMRIAGTIDENKGLNDLRVGQVASFTIDALPGKTFWGYVDEISPIAKQTQLSFSISSERPTQQFVVYAKFDSNKYPEIKNGMSAKMKIYTATK